MDNQVKEACDHFMNTDAISTSVKHGRVLAEAVFAADPTSKAGDVDFHLRGKVADLLHLTQFYPYASPADTQLALKVRDEIKAILAATPSLPPQGEAQADEAARKAKADETNRVTNAMLTPKQKRASANIMARQAEQRAAATAPQGVEAKAVAPEQMFLVSYVGLLGLSECGIWREATEEAFHTFVPAYRRKVQVIDAAQALPVADTASAVKLLAKVADLQARTYGNGIDLHLAMITQAEEIRDYLAALQQTQGSGA